MKKISKLALTTFMSVFFYSCGTGDISREFTKDQAVRLLSADNEKSWSRVSKRVNGIFATLDDCEQNDLLSIRVSSSDSTLFRLGELPGCDPLDTEPDTLFRANWSLTQNINLIATDTLQLTSFDGNDLNPFVLSTLTARKLAIQYIDDNSNLVVEEYSF